MKLYWTIKASSILLIEGSKLAVDVLKFVWETESKHVVAYR